MSDRELEHALRDLGAHLDQPATPPLAELVAARLREAPERRPVTMVPGRRRLPSRRWQRLAVAGLAVAVLAAAVLVLSPGTREAVADLLGLRGIRIQLGGPRPTSTTPPTTEAGGPGASLGLGSRTTLDDARRSVKFPVRVPTAAGFDRPDAVYVDPDQPADGRVDFIYRARPGLPASPYTEAGLLITQFRASVDLDYIKKVSQVSEVEFLSVHGEPAFWFAEPHDLVFLDRSGSFQQERVRLAGSTLIWQQGDVTYRLEGRVARDEAVRIAESMR
jgi:anti-sigma factor RsiW